MHYFFAFVGALAILVVFHELGHYLAARCFNVKVLRFAFGFGPTLWVRQLGRDQTEWAICLFPLGGYVKMLDESEGEVNSSEMGRAFNRIALWKRSIVVAAGPLANLLLAVVIYAAIFMHGVFEYRPIVATPPSGSIAAESGVKAGSQIVKLNGTAIDSWQDLRWVLLREVIDSAELNFDLLSPSGKMETLSLPVPEELKGNPDKDGLRMLGLQLPALMIPAIVGQVSKASPAEQAGLLPGDVLIAVNGMSIGNWQDFAKLIRSSPEQSVALDYSRAGTVFQVVLSPTLVEQNGEKIGRVGVSPVLPSIETDPRAIKRYFGPIEAAAKGFRATWDTSVLTLKMMGQMIWGNISWRNVSGPITIADYAGQSAQMGPEPYLRFIALISISLGILNLLPIPVLDGGHLMYYLIEGITGKPVQERLLDVTQRMGVALLGTLMVFAFYNDITRLISS